MMMKDYRLHDVFISYRRREKDGSGQGREIAGAIYEYLSSKGLRVFWDIEEMENGKFTEQLEWQVVHTPNYLFIATDNAMRPRVGPDLDYVHQELECALGKYNEYPDDRMLLVVRPAGTPYPSASDASFPKNIHELFTHRVLDMKGDRILSAGDSVDPVLMDILKNVTEVKRRNLWNAGQRWLEEAKEQSGSRFANLDIDRAILPLAGARNEKNVLLPIRVRSDNKRDRPLMDMIRDTPGHLYLVGEGGMGKTTALFSIMEDVYGAGKDEKDVDRNRLEGQVPLFIELSRAPDTYGRVYEGGRSTFIQRAVYQLLRADLKVKQMSGASVRDVREVFQMDPDTAVTPIRDLFTRQTPSPEYLLLLDGLNEVSRTEIGYTVTDGDGTKHTGKQPVVSMILREIRELMSDCPNVRIILTSRTREETAWDGKASFLFLSGLEDETVENYLKERNQPQKRIREVRGSALLRDILRVPLFLTMYATLEGDEEILTRGEILHLFFHQKKDRLYTAKGRGAETDANVAKAASADQPDRLTADMLAFILDFILPEIAWKMAENNVFRIGMQDRNGQEGLRRIIWNVLTDRGETAVCGENGADAFIEYRGGPGRKNTRKIAKELYLALRDGEEDEEDARMAITEGILECAVMTLGILRTDDSSGVVEYGFIHHHIRDYFSAVRQINCLRLAVYTQGNGNGETARACLDDWRARPLPATTRQFIGEALGEAHNAAWCDGKGNWHYSVPKEPCDRNLLKRAFDIYRDRFDGQDGYGVWNLLQILKEVRADLAGEDLSRLDLTRCVANGHALGKRGLAAAFDGAKTDDRFFIPAGHTDGIISAVYSPDSRTIITASEDNTAKVWDADTLQLIGTLSGHTGTVESVAYSPDGRRIVTASWDGTVKVWDADSLQPIGTLSGHTRSVNSAAYSPDGRRIVTAFDNTAKLWDADTLQLIGTLSGHTSVVNSIVYSPDGCKIVTASMDCTVKVWDADTLQPIGTLIGHTNWVHSAAYSPDGHRIVTASRDNTVKVWDSDSLKPIGTLSGHTRSVKSATYSPDGRRIITASWDETAKVWDADTLQLIGTLSEHTGNLNSAAYSPDGHRIVTASWDRTAKIWDADSLQPIGTLCGYTGSVSSVAYSLNDRSRIVTASWDHTAKVWDVDTLQPIGTLSGHTSLVSSAAYSSDGCRIVTASEDNTAKVWDADSLQPIGTLCGHTSLVSSAAYSPDGCRIVTASEDNTAKVWDADSLQLIGTLCGHTRRVNSAAFSPDGHRIITASDDDTVKVWDADTLQPVGTLSGHTSSVFSAAYSPNGCRIVTASHDETAKVWDADTLQHIGTLNGHTRCVDSAAYSPDGRRIVTASWDGTAKVWDADSLQLIGTLSGHTGSIFSAAYSPDGQRIITASQDSTINVWSAESFELLHTIHNIPGLEVIGVDLRRLHPDSVLSPECLARLKEYGAIVTE